MIAVDGVATAGEVEIPAAVLRIEQVKLLVADAPEIDPGTIAAALGAMVNSDQELQQLNMILVMPLAGCMFALAPVISNPTGIVARVISLIPFCTPLIMYLRISLATPPAWEIALSIALMIVTIVAILWVTARIYRVGILMYGKRPNLPEIMRWLKYS